MADTIRAARAARAAGFTKKYSDLKLKLPSFVFMANFMPNNGKKGNRPTGLWHLQSAAKLTGMIMHDFDHLGEKGLTPRELYARIPEWMKDDKSCPFALLYAGVTPSGDGLRLVTMADVQRGNIAQNQQHIARLLNTVCDGSVKNADRLSFAVTTDDIIYINDLIFTYENPEYDSKYGNLYRAGDAGVASRRSDRRAPSDSPRGGEVAAHESAEGHSNLPSPREGLGGGFGGVPAQTIIDKWIEERGVPAEGTRHLTMLRLAGDLRYICENDPVRLKQWVMLAPFVQDIVRERGEDEVTHACEDVCDRKLYMSIPRNFNAILEQLGATKSLPLGGAGGGLREDGSSPLRGNRWGSFWQRLQPLLAPPYDVACSLTEDENKLGAVFAAGAMYCTLMTRCWYEHFDGMEQRLNPQVYIIGMPAAGKSFADKLDNIIMGPMKAADAIGREAEAEYKRKLKERQTSSKAAKGEPLKKPEVMIRYCPSKTSNHVLFHRLENAREMVDGKEMHLHIYTFDSELDANTAAQRGGSWIDKHDIELKAFHNECTGVDYSNPDSSNGIFPVYYNTVCTGTPLSLQRKINIRNVNDGLCSRIAFFKMKDDGFHMIARGNRLRNHAQECKIKQWAFRFDSMKGELKIGRLVDHVYNLCQEATWTAEASGDRVLDMLRKRAVFYAIWFTIPRIYARQWKQYEKTGEVEVDDSDLQFATLIYDAVLYWQDRLFGRMLEDSWQNAENDNKPRVRRTVNDEVYARLPQEFDTKAVIDMMKVSKGGASAQLRRWLAAGLLERTSHGKYRKKGASA